MGPVDQNFVYNNFQLPIPPQEEPIINAQLIQTKALIKNMHFLTKHMNSAGRIDPARLKVITRVKDGTQVRYLKEKSILERLFNREDHEDVGDFIGNIINNIQVKNRNEFTPKLAIAVSRYNQHLQNVIDTIPNENYIQLVILNNEAIPEIKPKNFLKVEKRGPGVKTRMDQPDLIRQKRGFGFHDVRVYRNDQIDHQGKEAAAIFVSTQMERIKNLAFRLAIKLGFSSERITQHLRDHDYYYGDKDTLERAIYCKDQSMELTPEIAEIQAEGPLPAPTSYWLGHASLLLGIHVRSLSDPTKMVTLRVITDPVEGDLAPILYPRMTKSAKSVEKIAPPQVYLLSHNHLDHYNSKTIDKLLSQQPVMIVPKGDGYRYLEKGFKNVQELDWWESANVIFEQDGEIFNLDVNAVPARHWAGQGPCGGHESTFLGYVIKNEGHDIYFAGDTARLDNQAKDRVIPQEENNLRETLHLSSLFDIANKVPVLTDNIDKATKSLAKKEADLKKKAKKTPISLIEQHEVQTERKLIQKLKEELKITQHVFELRSLAEEIQKEIGEKQQVAAKLQQQIDRERGKDPQDEVAIKKLIGEKALVELQRAYFEAEHTAALNFAQSGEQQQQLSHVETIRSLFNISYNFQPGGPDEVRTSMESTHQASVDSLWMHAELLLKKVYVAEMGLEAFIEACSTHKTVLMHTMAYKLGNLKLLDTPVSLNTVLMSLENEGFVANRQNFQNQIEEELKALAEAKYRMPAKVSDKKRAKIKERRKAFMAHKRDKKIFEITHLKRYEWQVFCELVDTCATMQFANNDKLSTARLAELLRATVIVPKIGSNLNLGEQKQAQNNKIIF